MGDGNVDLHRRLVAAFNDHDAQRLVAAFDPQVQLNGLFAALGAVTTYHGHDGVRRWLGDLEETWGTEIRAEPEAYFDLGEQTLMFYVLRGRGVLSGAETAMSFAQVLTWRDGLCVYYKGYADRAEALARIGVKEDALRPIAP